MRHPALSATLCDKQNIDWVGRSHQRTRIEFSAGNCRMLCQFLLTIATDTWQHDGFAQPRSSSVKSSLITTRIDVPGTVKSSLRTGCRPLAEAVKATRRSGSKIQICSTPNAM